VIKIYYSSHFWHLSNDMAYPTQSHESAYLYHDCHFSWHLYVKYGFCVHWTPPGWV